MKAINLFVAFILELIAFVAFAVLAYLFPINPLFQLIIAIILFVAVIGFWSLYMSPKAKIKLTGSSYYLAKVIIYGFAAYVLFAKSGYLAGCLFIVIFVLNELFLYFFMKTDNKIR